MSEKLVQLLLMIHIWDIRDSELYGNKYNVSLNAYTLYQKIRYDQEPLSLMYYYYMYLIITGLI